MERRKLGSTQLEVTELGFGGAPLGNLYYAISNAESDAALQQVWDSGIRYFDTAPQYGSGLSEHRLGHFLREQPRSEFVLSTKVGKLLTPTRNMAEPDEVWFVDPLPNAVHYDYSYDGIMRSIDHSLHRLGTSHIDIAHFHDLDRIVLGDEFDKYFKQAMESGYRALEELKQQGVIDAISLGVKQWQVCAEALEFGEFDCFMLQDSYTLLDFDALDFLNTCVEKNISVLQAGPFSSGILVKGIVPGAKYNYSDAPPEIIARVEKLSALCSEFNVPLPAAALQFPLRHQAIASVVTGMRKPEHVQQNVAWFNLDIPQDFWDALKQQGLIPQGAY